MFWQWVLQRSEMGLLQETDLRKTTKYFCSSGCSSEISGLLYSQISEVWQSQDSFKNWHTNHTKQLREKCSCLFFSPLFVAEGLQDSYLKLWACPHLNTHPGSCFHGDIFRVVIWRWKSYGMGGQHFFQCIHLSAKSIQTISFRHKFIPKCPTERRHI